MTEAIRELAALDATMRAELLPELEVVRRLGTGSTSYVYLAREPALQRLVALKVLKPELASDVVLRQRFEREAQSAARIVHPHVTSIHRIGRMSGDVPYMVIEYIDGRTVRDALAAHGPFSVGDARRILAEVAGALGAAHARGIVHRDVRPANVFLETQTGRAVLGDFGIAALLDSGSYATARLTAPGIRLGDVRYMSPEQVSGEPPSEQSDIYALGVLAYELLTGRGPYDAHTDAQQLVAHRQQQPRRLRELRPEIDEALARQIEQCLAKEPQQRPLAQEVVAALDPHAATVEATTRGGTFDQFLTELRRRRVYQVLVGYGALAGVLLGFGEHIVNAFELSRQAYRVLVVLTLAGFPVSLVLSWLFDAGPAGIRRTRSHAASVRMRIVMWLALALVIATVAALGWLLLRAS